MVIEENNLAAVVSDYAAKSNNRVTFRTSFQPDKQANTIKATADKDNYGTQEDAL